MQPTTYRKLVQLAILCHGGAKGTSLPALTRIVGEIDPKMRSVNKGALKRAVNKAVEEGEVVYHKRYPRSLLLAPSVRRTLRKNRTTQSTAVKKRSARKVSSRQVLQTPKRSTKPRQHVAAVRRQPRTALPRQSLARTLPRHRLSSFVTAATNDNASAQCELISDKYDTNRFSVHQDSTGGYYDCMLVQRDLSINMDKFYKMQVMHDSVANEYLVVVHFGRTGTVGQFLDHCKSSDVNTAVGKFEDLFHAKVGLTWAFQPRDPVAPAQLPGKYQVIKKAYPSAAESQAAREQHGGEPIWQYFVNDGVDGKRTGWYNYDDSASNVVEGIYHEWVHNNQLGVRCVDSGCWQYSVSFNDMTQTNIKHSNHTQRKIRRGVRLIHEA